MVLLAAFATGSGPTIPNKSDPTRTNRVEDLARREVSCLIPELLSLRFPLTEVNMRKKTGSTHRRRPPRVFTATILIQNGANPT